MKRKRAGGPEPWALERGPAGPPGELGLRSNGLTFLLGKQVSCTSACLLYRVVVGVTVNSKVLPKCEAILLGPFRLL